jgi:hypothetical protein
MMDLAGAAEMPVTKLFGRSPAGLNATGESDMQNYYDSIEEKQEAYLSPILDKLLPVMACSEWGGVPDDMDWEFNPVRRPTEDERKSLSEQISSAVFEGYNAGLITQRMALKELRQSTELTGMWSNITDEDIERASDEYESDMADLMGGFGGGGFGEQEPGQEPKQAKPFSLDGLTVDFNKYHEEANGRFAHAPDDGGGGGGGKSAKKVDLAALGAAWKNEYGIDQAREDIKTKYSHEIKRELQDRHRQGTKERSAYEKSCRENGKLPPSYFTADIEREVLSKLGSGRVYFQEGNSEHPREAIRLDRPIGKVWSREKKRMVDTGTVTVVYSKGGIHFYPVEEAES